MSEIQNIRLNKIEVKLADTDDPVAGKASWNPLKRGGANFKTHELMVTPTQITVKKSRGGLLFGLVFFLPGVFAICIAAPGLFLKGEIFPGLFMLLWGSIFGAAGAYMLFGEKPLTFDKISGIYFRGKNQRMHSHSRDKQGSLADIHALQLLSENVHSSRGSSNYSSYELNLVFADGERLNVMDHGEQSAVLSAAKELGQFLDVPIWQASF